MNEAYEEFMKLYDSLIESNGPTGTHYNKSPIKGRYIAGARIAPGDPPVFDRATEMSALMRARRERQEQQSSLMYTPQLILSSLKSEPITSPEPMEKALDFMNTQDKARWTQAEEIILNRKSPLWAYLYAFNIIGGPWPEAEEFIMKKPSASARYAMDCMKATWISLNKYEAEKMVRLHNYTAAVGGEKWDQKDLEASAEYRKRSCETCNGRGRLDSSDCPDCLSGFKRILAEDDDEKKDQIITSTDRTNEPGESDQKTLNAPDDLNASDDSENATPYVRPKYLDLDYGTMDLNFFIAGPNSKLANEPSFSVRSGWTCPSANLCKAKVIVNPVTGKSKLQDKEGKGEKDHAFRCFSSSQEVRLKDVYERRHYNELLAIAKLKKGGPEEFAKLMVRSIEESDYSNPSVFRIHVGGDFVNNLYLSGWILVAQQMPNTLFYAYTKEYKRLRGMEFPSNFKITHSVPNDPEGTDKIIMSSGRGAPGRPLKFAYTVFSIEEAQNFIWKDENGETKIGLEIDHDDSHAYANDTKPFALLLHGTQPAGSEASKALSALKKQGHTGYSPKKKRTRTVDPSLFSRE